MQLKRKVEAAEKKVKWTDDGKDIDDGTVEWTEGGMDDYAPGSAAYDMRHKKADGPHGCSLSAVARGRLPSLDEFMERRDPVTGQFAIGSAVLDPDTGEYKPSVMDICFDMNFPPAAVKLFTDKVLNNCLFFVFRASMSPSYVVVGDRFHVAVIFCCRRVQGARTSFDMCIFRSDLLFVL